MKIDLEAFATYALDVFDCSDEFEDDEFVVEFEGQRIYVERKRSLFVIHTGKERIRLPRA